MLAFKKKPKNQPKKKERSPVPSTCHRVVAVAGLIEWRGRLDIGPLSLWTLCDTPHITCGGGQRAEQIWIRTNIPKHSALQSKKKRKKKKKEKKERKPEE